MFSRAYDDPASYDSSLRRKLAENKHKAKGSLDEVSNDFDILT